MKHLDQPLKDYPDYTIKACTNTGVWVVEQVDPVTQTRLCIYDFVNGDFAGPETGGGAVSIESLGTERIETFKSLRTDLNKMLEKDFKT